MPAGPALPFGVGFGCTLTLPAHNGAFGLPGDHRVYAEFCCGFNCEFIPVTFSQGLDQDQPDVRAVFMGKCRAFHRQFGRQRRDNSSGKPLTGAVCDIDGFPGGEALDRYRMACLKDKSAAGSLDQMLPGRAEENRIAHR
jgi:hypothetical protein